MVVWFSVPTTLTAAVESDQFGVARFEHCCKVHPVEGAGQATTAVLLLVRKMRSNGAPGVCTATAKGAQKPPMSEKLPPFVGPPASGWPRVPLNEYCPFVLVPPPPAILDQVRKVLAASFAHRETQDQRRQNWKRVRERLSERR